MTGLIGTERSEIATHPRPTIPESRALNEPNRFQTESTAVRATGRVGRGRPDTRALDVPEKGEEGGTEILLKRAAGELAESLEAETATERSVSTWSSDLRMPERYLRNPQR